MADVDRNVKYVEFVVAKSGSDKTLDFIFTWVVAMAFLFIPTGFWFCFDDHLAELVGIPGIGEVPFWSMYAFCNFWGWLTRRTRLDYSDWKTKPRGAK